ncbi:MAG: VWA domain-containing protein [Pyrinomonadaceae bacterium]|nr:VWA domain-containing protein [Pyrinomonadaceae bacterium]
MATKRNDAKPTLTGLARKLGELTTEKRRVALELSAALAAVSLKVSRAFVASFPDAARILSADDLRNWGEFGRRLAIADSATGVKFFTESPEKLQTIPETCRATAFAICTRQLVLSRSIALASYDRMLDIATSFDDHSLLRKILDLALQIATRSARHSTEFLEHTPAVAKSLNTFANVQVTSAVFDLASDFVIRTGGLTAELWQGLPNALDGLPAESAVRLLNTARELLEYGGSVTLHFVTSGSVVLRTNEQVFDEWCGAVRSIASHGNAVVISFLRATTRVFPRFPARDSTLAARRVLQLISRIAETDAESALAAFTSSASALGHVSLAQFEAWVENGLTVHNKASAKARRSYFALETRASNDHLQQMRSGLALDDVQHVLRLYVEALTGKQVEVRPLGAMPQESRIGDGKTIYLPGSVAEFSDDDEDFRLYKVLAAHAAGQIEFGTFDCDTTDLNAAYTYLATRYSMTAEDRDAFSLDGYINRSPEIEGQSSKIKDLPAESDYRAILGVFPEPRLARRIFTTVENARIDIRLRHAYRGLVRDLDLMQELLRSRRPYIFDLPAHQVPFELLFQITLCGGATDDARMFYGQVVSEIETVIETHLASPAEPTAGDPALPTVADALIATSRVYTLFQNITPDQQQEAESDNTEEESDFAYDDKHAAESVTEDQVKREQQRSVQDISDLFNAWNSLDDEGDPDDLSGSESWSQTEMPEQQLEADDIAFAYDEWDRELNDYRVGWSRVIEKRVKQGDRTFVELTRSRYRAVISSIRHQFQLMKPENLTRINRELDGEDYDLNALVDFVIDRKADGRQSENIYTKRLRKQRDVAVSLLLDQSSSTARTITRNPLQPYTHPGRRIIEIEKEGLVLMSEALEAVGDVYSISGFTSEGRRNVKFYIVKDFSEKYSDETEKRIGGITFQNNTRLGAAIRHASHRLLRQDARTKLLIILTDGRPYDHDYGDARYAREDVREALIEAKTNGVTPFCITIDRESEAELKDLYGDVGYTIIDDVLSLPERMPNIYRRLTS